MVNFFWKVLDALLEFWFLQLTLHFGINALLKTAPRKFVPQAIAYITYITYYT